MTDTQETMEFTKKRAICLYRVSTKGQMDKEKNDIPMQKQCCREFAERQGWEIVKEVMEKGVSGFKISAAKRDAIQEIQQDAIAGTFDILLVFMFDRLGRKDDETPFVVEWFVNQGIEVWSSEEGQQRFDTHVDKLMNYIRYWQASGESVKTSIRTRTRLGQIVQEGGYKGGTPPYGYRLEKSGHVNKKNHELSMLVVDELESAVVKLIFDKYVNEGFGAQRLVGFLLEQGIRNRKGDNFANTTLIKMLRNTTYIGILRCGEVQSEPHPELQIIDSDMFERAQEIMVSRTQKHGDVPISTKANALLTGLVYCGHCGSKLVLTTSHGCAWSGGPTREIRYRYQCHYKVRHPQSCEGQSGYSVKKLDAIVEEALMKFFDEIREVPGDEAVSEKYQQQITILSQNLKAATAECESKRRELVAYEAEVSKAILGDSQWDIGLLQRMIEKAQEGIVQTGAQIGKLQQQLDNCSELSVKIQKEFNQVISWSRLFSTSSIEAKKMIVAQLIRQVRVYKNYCRVEIDFKISKEDFNTVAIDADVTESAQEGKTSESQRTA